MVKSVLIGTFSVWKNEKRTAINGMIEPLLSYFAKIKSEVNLIDGPPPGSDSVTTKFEQYEGEKIQSKQTSWISLFMYPLLNTTNNNETKLSFKLRDFLSVFEYLARNPQRYDLFIGLESVFTIAGILLKRLGLARNVVYYVSDYSPNRYNQRFLNNIYLTLDRFCCYNADYIWDVSPAMHPARIKAGLDEKKSKNPILVPNALFPEQICPLKNEDDIEPFSLVFAGTFGPENGLPIIIQAMPSIIDKLPKTKLHVFGGGHTPQQDLEQLAEKLNVGKHVIFHGFISDARELSGKINRYMVGVAPYAGIPDSARWYADATKLRLYMGAGLPIITTHVPPLGKEIEKYGAGVVSNDSPEAFSEAILKIFSDKNTHRHLREKTISYAKPNTWENSYANAFKQMGTSND